jgi:hypothetical protein
VRGRGREGGRGREREGEGEKGEREREREGEKGERERGREREREGEREGGRGREKVRGEQLTKSSSLNHIHNSARSTDNYLLTQFEFCNICSHIGASNTRMTLGIEIVTQSKHNLCVEGGREEERDTS